MNFGVFCSLRLWGWGLGGWGWGVVGGALTHMHMHMHTHACMQMHTCTHAHGKHDNFMQMATPIGGIPENSLCHTCMCVHACTCMHMHVHVCGATLSPSPTHIHPPPTLGGTPGISQNSIALELIKIFQFHLKI